MDVQIRKYTKLPGYGTSFLIFFGIVLVAFLPIFSVDTGALIGKAGLCLLGVLLVLNVVRTVSAVIGARKTIQK